MKSNSKTTTLQKLILVLGVLFVLTPIQVGSTETISKASFGVHIAQAVDSEALGAPAPTAPTQPTAKKSTAPLEAQQAAPPGDNDGSSKQVSWGQEVVQFLGSVLLNIGKFIVLTPGSWVLDSAIKITVVEMTQNTPIAVINLVWGILRDVCNLVFIFGFIYIGIRTIFDPDSASTKRFLTKIIIGALLINFSLFFAKVVIDMGNYTAVTIYNSAMKNYEGKDIDLSDLVLDTLELTSISGKSSDAALANMQVPGIIFYYFMAFLFIIFTGFIFFIAGIMLIVRFATLIFVLIASPALFAATVFPQTEKYASQLWNKLISNSLYPAVFLFLIFVSLKVIEEFKMILGDPVSGAGGLASALQPAKSDAGWVDSMGEILVLFSVAILLMAQSVMIAKNMAAGGGNMATGAVHGFRKKVQGNLGRGAVRTGFGAARGLKTGVDVARGANGTRNLKESWGNNSNISLKGLSGVQDDWRKSNSRWKKFGAGAMRASGADAGIQAVNNAKFGSSESIADVDKTNKEVARARVQNEQVSTTSGLISTVARGGATATPADRIAMEQAMANSSGEQILKLHDSLEGKPGFDAFVGNLSASQYDALMKAKPEDLNDGQKETIRTRRAAAVQARIDQTLVATENAKRLTASQAPGGAPYEAATITDVAHKVATSDLDALDPAIVQANAGRLTTKQIDEMKNLTPTQKSELKRIRKEALIAEATTAAGLKNIFDRLKNPSEASKLPHEILTNPNSARYLTPETLTKALENDDLEGHRATIRQNIENHTQQAGPPSPADIKRQEAWERYFKTPAGNNYA